MEFGEKKLIILLVFMPFSLDQVLTIDWVMVFQLEDKSSWLEIGTGYVEVQPTSVMVRAEENPDLVLVSHDTKAVKSYTRQGLTIIIWFEPSVGSDFAISFQRTECCSSAWAKLKSNPDLELVETEGDESSTTSRTEEVQVSCGE